MSMPGDSWGAGEQRGVGYDGPAARPRNGFGVAAVVLGLLALVLFWTIIGGIVFGILALVFGVLGRGRARRGEATNGGLSVAGAVLGGIGLVVAIGLLAYGVSLINSPAGESFRQCLRQAGGDRTMIGRCADEFSRQVGGR